MLSQSCSFSISRCESSKGPCRGSFGSRPSSQSLCRRELFVPVFPHRPRARVQHGASAAHASELRQLVSSSPPPPPSPPEPPLLIASLHHAAPTRRSLGEQRRGSRGPHGRASARPERARPRGRRRCDAPRLATRDDFSDSSSRAHPALRRRGATCASWLLRIARSSRCYFQPSR